MDITSFVAAAPEMTLLGAICVVLIADLFVDDDKRIITFGIALASLAVTLWALLATASEGRIVIFDGSYVSDPLSQVLKVAATGFVAVSFI